MRGSSDSIRRDLCRAARSGCRPRPRGQAAGCLPELRPSVPSIVICLPSRSLGNPAAAYRPSTADEVRGTPRPHRLVAPPISVTMPSRAIIPGCHPDWCWSVPDDVLDHPRRHRCVVDIDVGGSETTPGRRPGRSARKVAAEPVPGCNDGRSSISISTGSIRPQRLQIVRSRSLRREVSGQAHRGLRRPFGHRALQQPQLALLNGELDVLNIFGDALGRARRPPSSTRRRSPAARPGAPPPAPRRRCRKRHPHPTTRQPLTERFAAGRSSGCARTTHPYPIWTPYCRTPSLAPLRQCRQSY